MSLHNNWWRILLAVKGAQYISVCSNDGSLPHVSVQVSWDLKSVLPLAPLRYYSYMPLMHSEALSDQEVRKCMQLLPVVMGMLHVSRLRQAHCC